MTAPCLTCHDKEGQQLKDFPSFHSTLACTSCHDTTHGKVPQCVNCHKPHTPEMVQADCKKCHQAHKPLAVTYADDTPSKDCGACHDKVYSTLMGSQAKHKELLCATCHETKHKNIPQCVQCHEPHAKDMAATECTKCHQAHSPLPVTYGSGVPSSDCGACHSDVFKTLSTSKTKHQTLACTDCHDSKHGNIPKCTQCHEPHAADMTQADCTGCHKAHNPLPVTYASDMASKNCAACHAEPFKQLQASTTKHHKLSCATCHQDKHKTIPKCQDCHGLPHSKTMLSKFPGCGSCHQTAHNLLK